MATRGSLVIGKKRYYISYGADPRSARGVLRDALRIWKRSRTKTRRSFIRIVKRIAGSDWIRGYAPKSFGWPFEEYRWFVSLRKGTIKYKEILKPKRK